MLMFTLGYILGCFGGAVMLALFVGGQEDRPAGRGGEL